MLNEQSISSWEEVSNGAPQCSLWVPILFDIFLNDLDGEIECLLSRFANDTNLGGFADTQEHRARIQNDFWAIFPVYPSQSGEIQ